MLDYLIVGAGLFGATCARQLTDAGKRVLVIDKRPHIGGMAHDERRDGVIVGTHGGHIFHTDNKAIWEYVNRFADWRQYRHHVKAVSENKVYSFPINLMTFEQVYDERISVEEAIHIMHYHANGHVPETVEDWCKQNIGSTLYVKFIQGYTEKQWGRPCSELPASIIKRLPVRLTWNDEYFSDDYQGVPVNGYTAMIGEMLRGIDVELGKYFEDFSEGVPRVIYTGPLDALFGYQYGRLEYRSLRFEHERHNVSDYQGCAALNYCDADVPYTRIVEWKHIFPANVPHTWIMREYPADYTGDNEPYYPIGDEANRALYARYAAKAAELPNLRIGGRLGSYQYRDMAPTIAAALKLCAEELA